MHGARMQQANQHRFPASITNVAWDAALLKAIYAFTNHHLQATVVFDADGTLWADDASEAFLRWLICERKLINFDYKKLSYAFYEDLVKIDPFKAYRWIVTIMAGLREEDIKKWSQDFFQQYFLTRIYLCQKELINLFQRKNYDIWIVSASHEWIIKAGAKHLGIEESHVLGVQSVVENGVITAKIKDPFTFHHGKVAAIKKYISQQPAIAFGDSQADLPMLCYATDLRIFIHHAETLAEHHLEDMDCLTQFFPLAPALQFP